MLRNYENTFEMKRWERNECDVVKDSKMKKLVPGVDIIVL